MKHEKWLIVFEHAPGPQNARNAGANQATRSIFCFLDADVLLPTNWRSQMLTNFQDPWVAIGQSKIVKMKSPSLLNWLQRYQLLKFNSYFYFKNGAIYKDVLLSLDTAALMVRREWYSRVKGFDSELPRLEDTDFSLRVMYHGGDVFFEDRVCAMEMIDPNESILSFFSKYIKSVSLLPLLNSKHLLTLNLPFKNGIIAPKINGSLLPGICVELFFTLLQIWGLSKSHHPIIISYSTYIAYRVNPKKRALDKNLNSTLRCVWVGGRKRSYDLRTRMFSKSLE